MTKSTRGQTLVLACVTMLVLALMLMLSFNLANAVHEKIRLQATADAQALTTATLEARAMNTVAYMNRSIAGALVAQMGIHAWRAMAERDLNIVTKVHAIFVAFEASEVGECVCVAYVCNEHCAHATSAAGHVGTLSTRKSNYQSSLTSADAKFTAAVEGLVAMIKALHDAQIDVLETKTKAEIDPAVSVTLQKVLTTGAPQAEFAAPSAIQSKNSKEFFCALEIHSTGAADTNCPSGPSMLSSPARAGVMDSAARAARPDFVVGSDQWRSLVPDDFEASDPDCCNVGSSDVTVTKIDGKTTYVNDSNQLGAEIGSDLVAVSWEHNDMSLPINSKWESSYVKGMPCNTDVCFVSFRADASNPDVGQPTTYGAVTQDLWKTRAGGTRPWEINSTGKVSLTLDQSGTATLALRPQGKGIAVAKGKTYFHQLGTDGWAVPPNMFDPFWRAKLHPFGQAELSDLLGAVNDTAGKTIVDNDGPVEGRDL